MSNWKRGKAVSHWNSTVGEYIDSVEIDLFIAEITDVCKKHGMSISHEDSHGAFIIDGYMESNIKWLQYAIASDEVAGG